MIHSRSVWLAWVLRAMSGSATLSEAIAATTVASAMQTTVTVLRCPRGVAGESAVMRSPR